jgi:hypothetical protein
MVKNTFVIITIGWKIIHGIASPLVTWKSIEKYGSHYRISQYGHISNQTLPI